jgi:N-methylhydantoinase B
VPFDHGSGALRKGEIVEVITAGSGGYGSPEGRDTESVRRDLAEGRLNVVAASNVYHFTSSTGGVDQISK